MSIPPLSHTMGETQKPVDNPQNAQHAVTNGGLTEAQRTEVMCWELSWGIVQALFPDPEWRDRAFIDLLTETIDRYELAVKGRGPNPLQGPYKPHEILPGLLSALDQINREAPDYKIVRTLAELEQCLDALWQEPFVGLDLETEGLDPHVHRIATMQLSGASGNYIILWPPPDDGAAIVRAFLEDETVAKVAHFLEFETKFLIQEFPGLRIRGGVCTMISQFLLHAGLSKGKTSLAYTATERLRRKVLKDKELRTSFKQGEELTPEQAHYAALDALTVYDLWPVLERLLKKNALLDTARLEFFNAEVTAHMAVRGVRVGLKEISRIQTELLVEAEALEPIIQGLLAIPPEKGGTLFPMPVLLSSPDQIVERFQHLGIPMVRSGKDVLEYIDHPAAKKILEWRTLTGTVARNTRPMQNLIHPVTLRLHPQWQQNGTEAGRSSCWEPNLMNVPGHTALGLQIRQSFIPAEGCVFINADYSQVELRIAAQIANDPTMIRVFCDGKDIHSMTAARIIGISYEEFETRRAAGDKEAKKWRQRAKAVNFGFLYGMGAETFVVYARNSYQVELTLAEATEIRDLFFRTYLGIARWHRSVDLEVKRLGDRFETRTLGGRRRIFINPTKRQGLNTPVQGTGADIFKLSMVYLADYHEWLKPVIMVYDEVVYECPIDRAEEGKETVIREMTAAGEVFLTKVPVGVDCNIVSCWKEEA